MTPRRSSSVTAALSLTCALLILISLPMTASVAGSRPQRADGADDLVDRDKDKIYDDLEKDIAGEPKDSSVPVIVVFNGGSSGRQAALARQDVGAFEVRYKYETISAVAAAMSVEQVREMAARRQTDQIQLDAPMFAHLDTARAAFGSDKAQADFAADGNNEAGTCPATRSYCKDDTTVAVIDTGIHTGHADLDAGKVLGFANCLNVSSASSCTEPAPFDDNGHGTHVSSMIAGEGDGSTARKLSGVAPGASLVGVKVLDKAGSGSTSGVDAGVEWVITHRDRFGIDALNMSLGSTGSSDGNTSTERVVNRAAAAGVTPFVSAGNSGPGPRTIGSPAAAKFAVTVGAMADPQDNDGTRPPGFSLAPFSSRGPTADNRIKPDIAAAGVDIAAAATGTTNGYTIMSGTSMSSPFSAGVGALMLDANPAFRSTGTPCAAGDTSAECNDGVIDSTMSMPLKKTMTDTATDWGPAGSDNDYGYGRLDAYEAVKAARGAATGKGPAVPSHTFTQGSLSGTGAKADHTIAVSGTDAPIAITLVMPSWSSSSNPDFDVYLLDPSGAQVALAEGTARQETIGYRPTVTGNFTVRVVSYTGSGPYWFDASFSGGPPDTTSPAAPLGTTVTDPGLGGTLDVDWADNAEADLGGYNVYRTTDPPEATSRTWTKVNAGLVSALRDKGLANGTTYYYEVTAVDKSGNESTRSNQAQGAPSDRTPPGSPQGLTATAGDTRVSLDWADNSEPDLAGYSVYRSTDAPDAPARTWTAIATSVTTSSAADTQVTNGTTYYYRVTAKDMSGNESAASSEAAAKPVGIQTKTYAPDSVSILKGSSLGDPVANLNMDDGAYYRVSSTKSGKQQVVNWYGSATANVTGIKSLTLTYEGAYTSAVTQNLYVYNFTTAVWERFSQTPASTGDQTAVWSTSNPGPYISSAREMRLRVYVLNGSTSVTSKGDLMRFTVEH